MKKQLEKLRTSHRVKERYKEYCSGDFYKYTIICSCGIKVGGWSIEESEERWKQHKIEGHKTNKVSELERSKNNG